MKANRPKLKYFLKQLSHPYESTIKLNNFYKKYFVNFKKKKHFRSRLWHWGIFFLSKEIQ